MELISVIVPVYNVEKYLTRCVDSIRKQTYEQLEIILVDDGSPDGCPQMCDALQKADSRIKVVHKKNGGLGFARNSGLDVASGTYVTFIDSDDWISPTHIENLYNAAVKHQAQLVIGGCTIVQGDGAMQERFRFDREVLYEGASVVDKLLLPLIGADADFPQDVQVDSSSCMNLYRMDLIREYALRFISEKVAVAEDLFFNVDFLAHAQRVVWIKETGYFYFENLESISRKYNPKRFERTLNFYSTLQKQAEQYGLSERIEYRIDRSYLMKIRIAIRHIVLSNLPQKEKLREIKGILEHEITKEVLQRYPVDTYIPAMRLLAKRMRAGDTLGVYCLMWFREAAGRKGFVKTALKYVGVGR